MPRRGTCCSPVTVAVSGLEPFSGDKAGLKTQHEVPATLTAPTEHRDLPLLPIHTIWSFKSSPRALPKGCTGKQDHPPPLQLTTSPRHPM